MATGGITLDGTSQYLEYTGGSVITAYPYSVLAWIASPLTLAGEEHVGGLGSTTADCFSGAHYNSLNDSKQAYDRSAATGTATATKTASPHINNTTLQPILAVITSASSRTVYFANNTGTTDTFALSQTFTDFNRVTVGVAHRSSGYLQYMRGTVAEFHLYSTALTSSDFTTLLTTPPEDVTGWVDGWMLATNSDLTSIGGTRTLTAVGSPTTGSLTLPYTRSAPAPTLSSPSAGTPASTSCAISATTDSLSDGTIYYLARVGGSAAVAATIIATGQSQAVSASNPQTRTVTGLTAATASNYVDVVQVGTGGNSNVVTAGPFTTAASGDTTAPTLSGSIVIGTVSSTTIQISWSAGSDNIAVTSYEVSSSGGSSYTDVGNVLTYTFTGLTPSTSYGLRVRAKDAAGNVSSPAISSTQSTAAASGVGSISLNNAALYVFKRNNTTTIPSTAVTFWVSDITSGALIGTAITGLSTNSSGLVTTSISNASMTAGVTYRLNYEFGTGEYGVVKLPAV